ncbi:MAG: segregation and condensation protein [Archaeoglobaceae archaeon]|nr:segregation and condensation protein [Archaeoglobaceae archaeon]MDK2876750.1 segregation and condensation protein [Archaeoglobaceae archaeon]
MAKKGEIDPWNVDVIDVTDKFLKRLEEAKRLDLRISGRVLLYAAILVRMKADAIAPQPPPAEDDSDVEIIEWEELESEEIDEIKIEDILRAQRRRIRKINTLKDLIEELRKAEAIEKRRKKRRSGEILDVDVITSIPHDESMEDRIRRVEEKIMKLLQKSDFVTLFSIVDSKEELIDHYISLLHLVSRKKFQILQKEIYGDIEIRLFGGN